MVLEPPVEATPSPAYASWGQRFGAWLIDSLVVWGTVWGVSTAVAFAMDDAASGILALLVLILLAPLYYAFFHAGTRGQTPGKREVGISVRNDKTLGRIGLGRALARGYFIWLFFALSWVPWVLDNYWLSWSPLILWILDGLWPLWDPKHQTWHDKVVSSVVVRV